jgi:SPP1 family predicted phage head-tail adaptor
MRAGRLKKLIAIQAATETKGATGQTVKTWATIATVRAAIEPIRGDERIAAQGVQARLTHKVILRHSAYPTLTSAHRFLFGTRVFEITAPPVNSFESNREWICDCREIVT